MSWVGQPEAPKSRMLASALDFTVSQGRGGQLPASAPSLSFGGGPKVEIGKGAWCQERKRGWQWLSEDGI